LQAVKPSKSGKPPGFWACTTPRDSWADKPPDSDAGFGKKRLSEAYAVSHHDEVDLAVVEAQGYKVATVRFD
jgi:hypothetical protein